jgi:hypothetical protein
VHTVHEPRAPGRQMPAIDSEGVRSIRAPRGGSTIEQSHIHFLRQPWLMLK